MFNKKGFTLIEVMVAVAILAMAFAILLGRQSTITARISRSERMTVATQLATQKINEVKMQIEKDLLKNKFPEQDSEETGKFEEPFEDFRWRVTIKKVEIPISGGGESVTEIEKQAYQQASEQISKVTREVKVVIFWGDEDLPEEDQQKLILTTHVVKLN